MGTERAIRAKGADVQARWARWRWRRADDAGRKRLRRWAEGWLSRNAPVVVPVRSGRLILNGPSLLSRSVLLTGGYELIEEANFRTLIRPGMTVFDVGANIGVYTLLAADCVGPGGQVHAFEPVPSVFAYLEASVTISGVRNATLNPVAVSDRDGEVAMFLATDVKRSGWHALAPAPTRQEETRVRSITLDGYLDERGIAVVDALKIDIEGGELPAFRGASRLLSGDSAPVIQSEMCDEHCDHFGHTCVDVKRYLADHGYSCFRPGRTGEWEPVAVEQRHDRYENVLCLKPSHRDRLPAEWSVPDGG